MSGQPSFISSIHLSSVIGDSTWRAISPGCGNTPRLWGCPKKATKILNTPVLVQLRKRVDGVDPLHRAPAAGEAVVEGAAAGDLRQCASQVHPLHGRAVHVQVRDHAPQAGRRLGDLQLDGGDLAEQPEPLHDLLDVVRGDGDGFPLVAEDVGRAVVHYAVDLAGAGRPLDVHLEEGRAGSLLARPEEVSDGFCCWLEFKFMRGNDVEFMLRQSRGI